MRLNGYQVSCTLFKVLWDLDILMSILLIVCVAGDLETEASRPGHAWLGFQNLELVSGMKERVSRIGALV